MILGGFEQRKTKPIKANLDTIKKSWVGEIPQIIVCLKLTYYYLFY